MYIQTILLSNTFNNMLMRDLDNMETDFQGHLLTPLPHRDAF